MKKVVLIIAILLFFIFGASLYLNQIFLPKKIKALVISVLAQQTGKQVSLDSLEFNIFKGLVLRDLVISDGQNIILSTKQATCAIFIWPIFKKQIIIPSLNLTAPYIFLERRPDKSFNLQDLLVPARLKLGKTGFNVAVFKLNLANANLVFQDNTAAVRLRKEFKNMQLILQLGLPVKLKFKLAAQMVTQPPAFINATGEYKILSQEWTVNFSLQDLAAEEFSVYCGGLSNLLYGLIDLEGQLEIKDMMLQASLSCSSEDLMLSWEGLKTKINYRLQSEVGYNLETRKIQLNGQGDILCGDISGLKRIGQINNLNGKFIFTQDSLIADSLKAELWEVPLTINLGIKDFSAPVLNIATGFDLSIAAQLARDKFDFFLIDSASGQASLALKIYPDQQTAWAMQGELKITDADLKLDKLDDPVEKLEARVEFNRQGLVWTATQFNYRRLAYQSSGRVSDFSAPRLQLTLATQDLSASGDFDLTGRKVKITQLSGQYLDTHFLINGEIDPTDWTILRADLTGRIDLKLDNLNQLLEKTYPQIKNVSPGGQWEAQLKFNGPLMNLKSCYLQAKVSSSGFSLYGLKASGLILDFLYEQNLAKIPVIYISFYDGVVQGSGALNLNTAVPVYQLRLNGSGIDLAKLKNDTVSQDKNISGIFLGEIKLNGAGNDLSKLHASGSFAVKQGRLGELNLLQGLGRLLLTKDLANIEFTGCSCVFLLKDKFIYTDKLQLTSPLVDLSGPVRVGLDSSLEGALDVEILNQVLPAEGTYKDVTTALIGQGGKIGVIKLSGSLGQPKYTFKTAVGSIVHGLAEILLKK